MRQALIIIDVQNDYFPEGKKPLHQPEKALEKIHQLIEKFQKDNQPIIFIQHISNQPEPTFFKAKTYGVELHPSFDIQKQSIVIEKHYPNSFFDTSLQQVLQKLEIEQVILCGMMTHNCVDSTTRAARELGFNPILIADATATCDLTWQGEIVPAQQVQLAYFAALQNFATLVETHHFLQR
ncbi:MAG: cysteine hydrolase family protein [Acinetobacter sp.]